MIRGPQSGHRSCRRSVGAQRFACAAGRAACVLLGAACAAGARADDGFVASPAAVYECVEPLRPLRLPTAVAATADGRVCVLDGVHDRIVVFGRDGGFEREITAFGGVRFDQPVGLRVAADGALWVAGGRDPRVLSGTIDGALLRVFDVPEAAGGRRADPTDAAPTAEGGAFWVADNDNHRIGRFDLRSAAWQFVGGSGIALGQFEHPFQIAVAPDGDVFVSDVINARVQLLARDGAPVRGIGGFGVEPGQLFRPGGVALGADRRVWVADSVLGVIQVFRDDGSLVDVVRVADGSPLRLESPLGIALDASGDVLVVESRANRVRRFTVQRTQRGPIAAPPPRGLPATGQQSKACTLCHIEWMPTFSQRRDAALIAPPPGSAENPFVSRGEMCLSCHDGSVADSRRRVWDEHGHMTGASPPEWMRVPAHLPLNDGKLACRTCHSAHGGGAPTGDFRRAMQLRVENRNAELCVSCHTDKTGGSRLGTHPIGGMPWPVPDALVSAGARLGANDRELTCQVCHTPHGARYDHLLVMGVSSNQLCLNCHDQMRPGMFRDGAHAEHPLEAKLNAEQRAAVQAMNTRIGAEGQLVCLSCHKLHHGKGDRFLLADDLRDGQMCLRCHSPRAEMIGSFHDLRGSFPDERNRLGLTAAEGGPCSSCHLFHRYARQPVPAIGDEPGQCTTCHQAGQCAENKALGAINHPSLRCTECHNPHETRFPAFLHAPPAELCLQCHSDKAGLVGGKHDSGGDATWCAAAEDASGDACLSCHRPHGDERHGLYRVAPAAGSADGDGACLGCHAAVASGSASTIELLHPAARMSHEHSAGLPLSHAADGLSQVGCRTCHDPHAPAGTNAMLRLAGNRGYDLCVACHSDMRQIVLTSHSPQSLAANRMDSAACAPCHQVHGDARSVSAHRLWPDSLCADPAASAEWTGGGRNADDTYCLGCHRDGGAVRRPAIASHPDVAMFAPAVGGASLPLFSNGEHDMLGTIACRTCHDPHGRGTDSPMPLSIEAAEILGKHPQVRAFVPPNTCTNCHGVDALRRFLYFHDADRRGGPLAQPTSSR